MTNEISKSEQRSSIFNSMKMDANGSHAFGLLPAQWNTLLDVVKQTELKNDMTLPDGINAGVAQFSQQFPNIEFDKAGVVEFLTMKLLTEPENSVKPAKASKKTSGTENSGESNIPKPIKFICNIACHCFFILILAALIIAGVITNEPGWCMLGILVGVIYYITISKIISGACLLYLALAKNPIVIGLFLLLISVLFPPWQFTADHNGEYGFHSRKPAGFAFLFDPPTNPNNNAGFGIQIDFGRLFLEWAALAAVTGMVWVFVAKPQWLRGDKANRLQKFIPPTGNEGN